jgi:hypothetical protein
MVGQLKRKRGGRAAAIYYAQSERGGSDGHVQPEGCMRLLFDRTCGNKK